MNYTFKILNTKAEMLEHLSLIQQMYPKMTADSYAERLEDMIPLSYKQVAVFENEICIAISGYWVLTRLYCGKYIDVDNFIVDEAYRSKGVGKIMLNWMEEEGKRQGCRFSILDAYVENFNAHKFYFRHGYTVRGYHFLKRL